MALISLGSSTCSICGEVLHKDQEMITWQAFLTPNHPLWKYSDTGMHAECFEQWEHKEEFEHLSKYQPSLDINDPYTKDMIENHGMPDWIQKILDYRKAYDESTKK